MQDQLEEFSRRVNFTRYRAQPEGHYESFFLRANHPARPLALWIRYTIFSPEGRPHDAIGELWALFFDGERNSHAAAKQEHPFSDCDFDTASFGVRVGSASLQAGGAEGTVAGKAHSLAWELKFEGASRPVLLLPLSLYDGGFPKAKSLVSLPMARINGWLTVDGE